jgi:hypothetical protein
MSRARRIGVDFPFYVTEEEDGSLTFTWDRDHPVTSVFNDWTEDDFADMLVRASNAAINSSKSSQQ